MIDRDISSAQYSMNPAMLWNITREIVEVDALTHWGLMAHIAYASVN